ncbi:MAG: SRPBCC domain-containing protein, partial [Acidimicrobiia bacterium]|nr:SRPBCC domain-containing protein [Acidimicrobiia bacterium]
DQLIRWMGEEARIDARAGGQFWLRVQGDDIAVGEYVSIDPPDQVVITWGWQHSDDVPPGSSTITFDLKADGDDTVLSLTHADLPSEWCDRHYEGWQFHLPHLVDAVGQG